MPQPSTCFNCTQCDTSTHTNPKKQPLYQNGVEVVRCKVVGDIAVALAQTQAICLNDTQPVTPEHAHLQDITPKPKENKL